MLQITMQDIQVYVMYIRKRKQYIGKKFNVLEELLAQNWTQHVSGNVTQQSKNLTDRYTIIQYLG